MPAGERFDGALCFFASAPLADAQHGELCHCGKPATRHVYYGTGCGNVCGPHANVILRRKDMAPEPPNLVELDAG
jgi:hypothetical protein